MTNKTVKTFVSNKVVKNDSKKESYVYTATGGRFYEGFTTMKLNQLTEGVEGVDALLDANLKGLLPYREELEEGHVVNVYVEFELTDDRMDYKKVQLLSVEVEEKVYSVQEYLVKYDFGKVEVNVYVYHENQTKLTTEEIVEEARGYLEDSGIEVEEYEDYQIATLTLT
jgi:hypothetical protein